MPTKENSPRVRTQTGGRVSLRRSRQQAEKGQRSRLREVRVDVLIFAQEIFCVVCDRGALPAWLGKKRPLAHLPPDTANACFWGRNGQSPPLMWLPGVPRTPKDIGRLAHEALHAAFDIVQYMGIEYSENTEEVFCYVADHIVETILEELRKK